MTDFEKNNVNRTVLTDEERKKLIAERNRKRRESLREINIEESQDKAPYRGPVRRTVKSSTEAGVVARPSTGSSKAISTSGKESTGERIVNPVARRRATEAGEARTLVRKPAGSTKAVGDSRSSATRNRRAESELLRKKAAHELYDDDDEASEEEIKARFGKSKAELMSGRNASKNSDSKNTKSKKSDEPNTKKSKAWLYIKRTLIVIGVTLLLVLVGLYSLLAIINYGPSKRAHIVFVQSVRETSAIGFLSEWFTTDAELKAILEDNGLEKIDDTTDESLIHIGNTPTPLPTIAPTGTEDVDVTPSPVPTEPPIIVGDANNATLASDGRMYENLISDEDGIIIVSLSGSTYKGHMMIVLDPSRVIVGVCNNVNDPYSLGQKLTALIEKYDGVAGTNAGGFEDTHGTGTGSVPLGPTFSEGKLIKSGSSSDVMVGFNQNNVLMVGYMNAETAQSYGIRDAVSFGPALIINGQAASASGVSSGLNPRTAIGQREDGAVLLLVIDGRQASSLGASYADLIDEFKKFGAVNAANLDGGSSSQMYYKGEPVNSRANLIREREMPTAIIIKKK